MKYIDIHEVMDKVKCGRTWIYKQIGLGKFPAQIKLGDNCSRWLEKEVDDWMAARAEERKKAA